MATNSQDMDTIDRKIVVLLQDDASLSLAEIAHKVGLSQSPCWKRIQRLEKAGIILKRVALVSPESIGVAVEGAGVIHERAIGAVEPGQPPFARLADQRADHPSAHRDGPQRGLAGAGKNEARGAGDEVVGDGRHGPTLGAREAGRQ